MAVGVITIAALYFGREVFVPMALAVLLSFALGPPVLLLRPLAHQSRGCRNRRGRARLRADRQRRCGDRHSQFAHLTENLLAYRLPN